MSSPTDIASGDSSPTAPTELDGDGAATALPPVDRPPDLVGRILGRFRVIERLGAGGLGEVYRAEQEIGRAHV